MHVALAGCSAVADPEQPLLVDALTRLGVTVAEPAWDSGADWDSYALVVVRAAWDYVDRREEFLAWADTVARLATPASVLRWPMSCSRVPTGRRRRDPRPHRSQLTGRRGSW